MFSEENEHTLIQSNNSAMQEQKPSITPSTTATSSTPSDESLSFAARRKIRWFIGLNLLLVLALVCILGYRFIAQPKLGRPVFSSKQLTTNSEELPILTASISPDGSMIAFADETALFVGDSKVVERHTLTSPEGMVPDHIEWFTDGIHLLISSINPKNYESTVWSVPVLGGRAELLLRDARMAAPSVDSRHIVFVRNQNQLWIANSDGSNAKLFSVAPENTKFASLPQFSQDGLYILYCLFNANTTRSRIEARNIVSGETTLLFDSPYHIPVFRLLNNDELLVSQQLDGDGNNTQLVSISIHLTSGFHSVARVIAAATNGMQSAFNATKDGRTLLMVMSRYYSTVQIANLNKEGNELSNVIRLTLNDSQNLPSAWAPDSRSVLFFSNRSGHYNIYQQDINSTDAHALTSDAHDYLRPVISADGKWLFYFMPEEITSLAVNLKTSLMRQSMSSDNGQLIDTQADFYRGLHCATGVNKCVLAEHVDRHEIFYEFDPRLGKRKELTHVNWVAPINPFYWDVSYDGSRIAYLDTTKGTNDIIIINIAATPVTTKTIHVTGFDPFATLYWDAYGKGFYVSCCSSGDLLEQLHIKLDGTAEILRQQVGSQFNWGIPSPDGKYFAFQKLIRKSNIWLLRRQ